MKKQAVFFGLVYAAIIIIYRLVILLGGYTFTTFGWLYANITAGLLVIPFYIMAIHRERRQAGFIAGREALRTALTVFAVGAIVTSVYNYAEFEWKGKELALNYYPSTAYKEFLNKLPQVKPEDHQKIIDSQIAAAGTGGFRATTGKLFYLLLVGIPSAVLCAAFMKRKPATYRR